MEYALYALIAYAGLRFIQSNVMRLVPPPSPPRTVGAPPSPGDSPTQPTVPTTPSLPPAITATQPASGSGSGGGKTPDSRFFVGTNLPKPKGIAPATPGIHVETVIRNGRKVTELVQGNRVIQVYSNVPADGSTSGASSGSSNPRRPPLLSAK